MDPKPLERRLAAILSADVAGYSRLMAEDEAATVRTLNSHKEVMFRLIRGHAGRVVDAVGDNVLAEFRSAVAAVSCAAEIQWVLEKRNADLAPDRQMLFRIGVNLGDVIVDADRIAGHGVNIAARIESLAEPGGVFISGTVFDQVEGKLPLDFENQGPQAVKNIPRLLRVYRVALQTGASRKAATLTASVARGRLKNLVQTLASPWVPFLSIIIVFAASAAAAATPGNKIQPFIIAGSAAFSLLFSYLFFSRGLDRIPPNQRSAVTIVVLIVLALLLGVQARAVVEVVESLLGAEMEPGLAATEVHEPVDAARSSIQEQQAAPPPAATEPTGDPIADEPSEPALPSLEPLISRIPIPPPIFRTWAPATCTEGMESPVASIFTIMESVRLTLRDPTLSEEEKRLQLEEVAGGAYDFRTMARLAVARYWERFTPAQQQELVREFKVILVRGYGDRIDRYKQGQIEIAGERQEPRGDVSVLTRVVGGEYDGGEVNYRLREVDSYWCVVDVKIEGISLVLNYRDQFKAVLSRKGPEGLLEALRQKNAEYAIAKCAFQAADFFRAFDAFDTQAIGRTGWCVGVGEIFPQAFGQGFVFFGGQFRFKQHVRLPRVRRHHR